MLVFIDESGCPGFKFTRGSDPVFGIAMVIFSDGRSADGQQLRSIGGWKSNTVSRYVHLAAKDTRDIVQKMNEQMLGGTQETRAAT